MGNKATEGESPYQKNTGIFAEPAQASVTSKKMHHVGWERQKQCKERKGEKKREGGRRKRKHQGKKRDR